MGPRHTYSGSDKVLCRVFCVAVGPALSFLMLYSCAHVILLISGGIAVIPSRCGRREPHKTIQPKTDLLCSQACAKNKIITYQIVSECCLIRFTTPVLFSGCTSWECAAHSYEGKRAFHAKKVNLVTLSLVDQTSDRVFWKALPLYIPSTKHITWATQRQLATELIQFEV
jgi:hypothetical protein